MTTTHATAATTTANHPQAEVLFEALAQLRRRYRLYQWLEGGTRVVAAIIAAAFVQLLLDRWLELPRDQRITLNLVITVVWAYVIYRVLLRRLLAPADDRWLAGLIDRQHPELADQLSSAIAFAKGEVGDANANSPQLQAHVVQQAVTASTNIRFDAILNHARVKRRLADLAAAAFLVALAFMLQPTLMSTWFARNWLVQDIPWPRRVQITPSGFNNLERVHPRGEPLEITADLAFTGSPPQSVILRWTDDAGNRDEVDMTRIGNDRLTANLGTPVDDLALEITGGDARTPPHRIRLVDRPRIVAVSATLEPPAYTNMPPAEIPQATGLEVLAMSRVHLTATTNKPVMQAEFVQAGEQVATCELSDAQTIRVTFDPNESGNYQFLLRDGDGLSNARPVSVKLRVVADEAPEIALLRQDLGEMITPNARIAVRLEATDQYGLGDIELLSTVTGSAGETITPPTVLPLQDFATGQRQYAEAVALEGVQLALRPEQRLRFQAVAADQQPGQANVSETNPLEFKVVHPDDFLASIAQRELDLRREFEQIVDAQRGVREGLRRLRNNLLSATLDSQTTSQLNALERRQGWHASRCLSLAREFQQLLGELRANRLAEPGEERRLNSRIIGPLERIGGETYPEVTRTLEALHAANETTLTAAMVAQDSLITALSKVLANMLEWEGYREMIQMVEELVAAQEETRSDTLRRLELELSEILDLLDEAEEEPRRE